MKRLLLASAIVGLGLAGTIGTANAVILSADHVGIWSSNTTGAGDPLVNAVPTSRVGLVSTSPFDAAMGALNFNLTGASPSTIGAFLLADSPVYVDPGCAGACPGTNLSGNLGAFNHESLFEFHFVAPSNGTLVVTHDDGISLFTDGGAGNAPTGADLFGGTQSAPTAQVTSPSVTLTGGQAYDLFYTATNGLPEVLIANFTSAVPEPASLTLIGSALIGLGWAARRRRKAA